MSRIRRVSSGTAYPSPRFPNEPKNERSLRTCAEVVPPRRASSPEEMVERPWVLACSRNRRYTDSRRTVLSEIFRIVNYFTMGDLGARATRARKAGRATSHGFARANEGAHDSPADLARERFAEPRILELVDPRRLDVDIHESRIVEELAVFMLVERPSDATDPELHTAADRVRDLAAADDVGHGKPPTGTQHAERLFQHAALVCGEIDHAIRNDDVNGAGRQRNILDFALEKLDVGHAGLGLIRAREGEHFVRHVQAVGFARGSDALGGQQDVDATAGTEVQNGLAGVEAGEGGGVAATERREHRSLDRKSVV